METSEISNILSRAFGLHITAVINEKCTIVQCFLPNQENDYEINPDIFDIQFHYDGWRWYTSRWKCPNGEIDNIENTDLIVYSQAFLSLRDAVKACAMNIFNDFLELQ
jgi:hypothetical protein